MGGTLFACGPDYDRDRESEDFDFDDLVSSYYRGNNFSDVKTVLIRQSSVPRSHTSQIPHCPFVEANLERLAEAVEGADEAVVIANYRSRIDKGITQVKGWLRPPGSPPEPHPLAHLLSLFQQTMMKRLAEIPYDPDALFEASPHFLAELCLSCIQILGKMYDANGGVPSSDTRSRWSSLGQRLSKTQVLSVSRELRHNPWIEHPQYVLPSPLNSDIDISR
ncbi:hypothetical protein FB45DRAFT_1084534 [Roridomyces roridus]|uniref:Uncharacterized protein n=1 Tax=Roridomyces roridus TaxID=1738132 RepID=A0AAD7BNQ3_9AGAR|nr:hypothetical protein FB45DRAFT_1084534 [Roridomyces roridus]